MGRIGGYMSAVTAAVPPKIMPGAFAITMGQSFFSRQIPYATHSVQLMAATSG